MALPVVSRHWLTAVAPSTSTKGGSSAAAVAHTGMAYLRDFLQSKRTELARSPILLIASDVGGSNQQ